MSENVKTCILMFAFVFFVLFVSFAPTWMLAFVGIGLVGTVLWKVCKQLVRDFWS